MEMTRQEINAEMTRVGDYVCVYLKHGRIQIKQESEGVVIDVFDYKDELFATQAIWNEDLEGEVNEENEDA